jgi:hypothetical protein
VNWYLVVKYFHITAVAVTIGGMFARQLVRGIALKSDDIKSVTSLPHASAGADRVCRY